MHPTTTQIDGATGHNVRLQLSISVCLTYLFSTDPSRLGKVSRKSPEKELLGKAGAMFAYRPDALPVARPTVSKH